MGTAFEAEIASLLGQCNAEDLNNILTQIDGKQPQAPPAPPKAAFAAPSGPPPAHGKRPGGRPVAPVSPTSGDKAVAPSSGASPFAEQVIPAGQVTFTAEDVRRMLAEHSKAVLSEVRQLVALGQTAPPPAPGDTIGLGVLADVLGTREREAKELEERLADLRGQLEVKDDHMKTLNDELDQTIREVRHRQLDLEFHQLKLEEKNRTNTEMEQVQRRLASHVEDASLSARHAALDVETSFMSPRAVRVQGSLPWTLRKNRAGASSYM